MSEKLNTENAGKRLLLIYSETGCMREWLPKQREGWYTFYLNTPVTGSKERKIVCCAMQGSWYVKDRLLSENVPLYLSEEDRQLLFILSKEIKVLQACRRLGPCGAEGIKIGKAYRNIIFYECFSLVRPEHLEILYEDDAYILQGAEDKGIYLNEKAFVGSCRLKTGDRIDLYGLHILVLKGFLVICTFQGISRVAGRWEAEKFILQKADENREDCKWVERYSRQEQVLHTGEVEILPPNPMERVNRSPLLLGLGPSLTMILPVLLMALLGSYYQQGAGGSFYYLSVVMSVCSSFLALFWGLVNHFYSKHQCRVREHSRVVQYREYLSKTETYLLTCQKENRSMLEKKYPPVSFFAGEGNRVIVMWDRFYRHKDFLFLRMGKGTMPFQMQIQSPGEKSIVPEVLWEEAKKLAEEMSVLSDVPMGVDFEQSRVLGITGTEGIENGIHGVLMQLLFQIAACHSYTEVKVACFYEKKSGWQSRIAQQLRWMPHIWSGNRRLRYLAGDEKEAAEILPALTKELEQGREDEKKLLPRYLVIVMTEKQIRGEPIYQYLTNKSEKYPVSAVFLQKEKEALPVGCDCLICKNGKTEEIICYEEEQIRREQIKLELCKEDVLQKYLRQLSGYRVKEEQDAKLPEKISFLELYQCEKLQQLNCMERWKKHKPEERMKIPIGVRADGGEVFLDIHEKFHGPHGLIAGTTGSGKSELIQTCILSMAVSFSPQDVNFFMIDYKGGGTGNVLQSLPHCSGVISNLSGKQIKRAMSAISSENRRRQKLLSEYQVNHIDGYMELYRRGKAKEAMPHLILVVDEFAELKKEEPEFMQEIISLAQVGRSLGMHLILATQKPAGTVDDKIWSNARFRLCLRVQDQQDSMDMLRKKDAALLTQPGQCYLQIGNHEYYELFQTAYCGGIYREEGEEKEKALLVLSTGKRIKAEKKDEKETGKSQLDVIVNYVNQIAKENSSETVRSLWLPELEEVITLEQLREVKQPGLQEEDIYTLGLCDDPANQQQYPAVYIPRRQGHLAVCGSPAAGKTTLLQTLLWQMMQRPIKELRVLMVDFGGGLWQSFQSFPQMLGFLKQEEDGQVFFYHLERLFTGRKNLLSGMNYLQYQRAGKGALPEIFFVIDNYASLSKLMNEHQEELLLRIAAEGINYGIYMVITTVSVGEMPGKLFAKIKKTIALEMSEKFSYGDVLRQYHIEVFPAENVKGRGLCRENDEILEFQTALAMDEEEDYLRMEKIRLAGEQMKKVLLQKEELLQKETGLPEVFPRIPDVVESGILCREFPWKDKTGRIPLGYDMETGRLQEFWVTDGRFLILGSAETGKRTLLAHMAEALCCKGMQVILYDSKRQFDFLKGVQKLQFIEQWEELQAWRCNMEKWEGKVSKDRDGKETKAKTEAETECRQKDCCLLIGDLAEFVKRLYRSEENNLRQRLWEEEAVGRGLITFLAGCCQPDEGYEVQGTRFFQELAGRQQGICLGGNVTGQRIFTFDDLSYSEQSKKEKPGTGYWKAGRGAETRRLKLPFYEGREINGNGGCGSSCAGSGL